MRSISLLIAALFITNSLSAQKREIKLGIVADYGVLTSTVNGQISDRYIIYSSGSSLDGFRLGVFGKVMVKKGFWNSELSYFNNRSFILFHNLKWQEDYATYGSASIDASGGYFNNMIRVSINRGFSIAKGFSFEGGIIAALQLKDKHYTGYPDSYFDPATMSKIVYRVADGFNSFLFLGNVRLAYNFGPLTVYGSLEKSLTPVADHVEFENVIYPLEYKIGTYAIGVTYTLFNSK